MQLIRAILPIFLIVFATRTTGQVYSSEVIFRYVLIGKEGEILAIDAPPPGSKEWEVLLDRYL